MNQYNIRFAILILFVCACGCSCQPSGQPTSDQPAKTNSKNIAEKVSEHVEAPGVVVGMLENDKRSYQVHGVRSMTSQKALKFDDCFCIGSLTKTFVAVVVMQLVDEGKISLDDSLAQYLPDVPRAKDVTIRQLLNHTSGYGDSYSWIYYLPKTRMLKEIKQIRTKKSLAMLGANLPMENEPGEAFFYAGTNYDLLALVIEKLSNRTLNAEMKHRIFKPLKMTWTQMAFRNSNLKCVPVTGHLAGTDFWPVSHELFPKLAPSTSIDQPMLAWAAGGLISNAPDLLAFADALFGGKLMSPESWKEMTTCLNQATGKINEDQTKSGYGFGIAKRNDGKYRCIGHGGMYSGYTVGFWHYPEKSLSIVVLCNRGLSFRVRVATDRVVKQHFSNQ